LRPQILSLPAFHAIVRWSQDGDAIQVLDVPAFSEKVLPLYFKVRAGAEGGARQRGWQRIGGLVGSARWRTLPGRRLAD
jgi:hypothetical protein